MFEHLKLGFFYTAIGKYSNVLVQLLVNMVLSRLLTPEQFGVVAVVQVFLVFFSLLVDAGLGPAIIENKELTEKDNLILFGYGIRLSFILAGIFVAFGPIISVLYNDWGYMGITAALAVTLLFQGFNTVPNALLDKAKRFKEVNIRLVLGNTLGGIAGITGAFCGLGAYALVLSSAVPALVAFILNLILLRIRPATHTSRRTLQKVFGFARDQFGFNFINYFARNADNLLIGKVMGPTSLANYSKAYQLLMMPNNVLLGVINPVLQPVLSDYKDDVPRVRSTYMKILRLLTFVGMPLSAFLSVEARDIILILFGSQWESAVQPFRILAATVWIQMTLSSSGAIYQAMNKSRWLLINGVVSTIIIVSAIIVGISQGNITAVAICLLIAFYINYVVSFSILMSTTLSSSFLAMGRYLPAPVITTLLYIVLELGLQRVTPPLEPVVQLLINLLILMLTVGVCAFITGDLRHAQRLLSRGPSR
jgi:O-antigen/teichoic acid export membrane protein